MSNLTIMSIPCGFKIKKKTDADIFINDCMIAGCEYFLKINDDFALVLSKDKNGVSLLEKRWELDNPFNPLLEVARTRDNCYEQAVQDYIWKYRKYINAKWFSNRD